MTVHSTNQPDPAAGDPITEALRRSWRAVLGQASNMAAHAWVQRAADHADDAGHKGSAQWYAAALNHYYPAAGHVERGSTVA